MHSPSLPLSGFSRSGSPAQICRKLLLALADLKGRLQRRFEQAYPGQSQIIRRALAEAEHLAWQTPFPHLLLPDLAEVRVTELVAAPARDFSRAA
jgi:hypothetical protein